MPFFVPLDFDDAGLNHFVVKVVAFARAFAHSRKHGNAAVQFGDVVNQFHNDDGLANAGATERADFAALQERADEVNDFDASHEHLR